MGTTTDMYHSTGALQSCPRCHSPILVQPRQIIAHVGGEPVVYTARWETCTAGWCDWEQPGE